jgi:enoyl-CoA hydratase/carnithine racemase
MLTHCDFVYAGESARFRMPFINLALVPEFGTSYSIPARIGYLRAADLIQLGQPFDAQRNSGLLLVSCRTKNSWQRQRRRRKSWLRKPPAHSKPARDLWGSLSMLSLSKQRKWRTRSTLCDSALPIPRKRLRRSSRNTNRTLSGEANR